MLENVRVDYYGSVTPLNQMASVNAPQADLLVVQPWDRAALPDIEKAIQAANLGLNPSNDGNMIRLPVPPLSEERRRDLVKAARSKGEDAKVAIRNVRRHSKDMIKTTQEEEKLHLSSSYHETDAPPLQFPHQSRRNLEKDSTEPAGLHQQEDESFPSSGSF